MSFASQKIDVQRAVDPQDFVLIRAYFKGLYQHFRQLGKTNSLKQLAELQAQMSVATIYVIYEDTQQITYMFTVDDAIGDREPYATLVVPKNG